MPYTTTTLAALRGDLQARYTGDPFWTEDDARDALNEALRQYNLYTGFWQGTATALTLADTPFLPVPASLTAQTRVIRTVGGGTLAKASILGWYRGRPGWRTQTTADGGVVPTLVQEWAPVGLRQIAVWPTPPEDTSLTLSGVLITPVLTLDGDFLDLGDEEHSAVLDEALYVLGFKRPSLLEGLQPRHTAFLRACLLRNGQLRQLAAFRQALGLSEQQQLRPLRAPVPDDADQGEEG